MFSSFSLVAPDNHKLLVRKWMGSAETPHTIIQIVHGMAEHSERYHTLASTLTLAGYGVFAHDQRGHGYSVTTQQDLGHFADHEGWSRILDDLLLVNTEIQRQFPATPIVLVGHSMGSFVALHYAQLHADSIHALVLSASTYRPPWLSNILSHIIRIVRWRLGRRGKSQLINTLAFGAFNKAFRPNRTAFDWLSRDDKQVDKYIADPLCGFECSVQLWFDLIAAQTVMFDLNHLRQLPHALPCYILSGECDPVQEKTGSQRLENALLNAGIKDVVRYNYASARHELFNELNREQVIEDLLKWLSEHSVSQSKMSKHKI